MPIVNHQAIQFSWITPLQVLNPRTLVLGSFNPYNPNNHIVDYYYGRQSNFFWRRVAILMGYDEFYFFDPLEANKRKLSAMNNRFCCLDLINNISFDGEDEVLLTNYINKNVYKGFSDGKIFTSQALNGLVSLTREYNQYILETLSTTKTITKVMHTMGNNRIENPLNVNPQEAHLDVNGFAGFMRQVHEVCVARNIEFIIPSFSPSAYAVRRGSVELADLDSWLAVHLNLNN